MSPFLGAQAMNRKSHWYSPEVHDRLSGEAENSWLVTTNPERGWEVECPDTSPVNSSAEECTHGILTQCEPQDLETNLALLCKKWNLSFYVCLTFHCDIWIISVMSKKYFYKLLLQLWIRFLYLYSFGIDIDIKEEGRKLMKNYINYMR